MTLTAQETFQLAYENRYTWDEQFPGYVAKLTLKQGEETYTGIVKVNPNYSVEVLDIENETVKESIIHQLRDVVTHRKRNSFESVHGKNQFSFGEEDDNGVKEILVSGEAMGTHYKIKGKEICQVNRTMGPITFSIDTYDSFVTEEGYISVGYDAIFKDSKTQEFKGKRKYQESYQKVGNYYVPFSHSIESIDPDGSTIKTEFHYGDHQLLNS